MVAKNTHIKWYRKRATGRFSAWLGLLIFLALGLAACSTPGTSSPAPNAPGSTPSSVQGQTSPAATATVTPPITPSPSPTPQPRAVLLAPAGADPQQVSALQVLADGLAAESGLSFQVLSGLSPDELTPDLRLVVALPPDPGLAALAAAAPGTQFLALGMPDLTESANLHVLPGSGSRPDQQGFLAGYLAALVTPDWRVGVISNTETPQGKANQQGFLNGVIFYCGLCRPAFPPFVQYPVTASLAAGAGQVDQQAAADSLIAQGVTTVYVAPGAEDDWLLQYLAGQGVNLIGTTPPPPGIQGNWIATISSDPLAGLRQAWEQALNGEPVASSEAPLAISEVNEALLSVGRQRLAEQVRDELASGLIDTGVDPLTGEVN